MDDPGNIGDFDSTATLFPLAAPAIGAELLVVAPNEMERFLFESKFSATIVDSVIEAHIIATRCTPRAIICCQPTTEAFEFLARTEVEFRVVMGSYDELPKLARARPRGVKILPRNVSANRLLKLLGQRAQTDGADDLLQRTFDPLSETARVVVRKADVRGIELVITPRDPSGFEFSIPGWTETPIDVFGLKGLEGDQRLFIGMWEGAAAYLAWVPWRDKSRITMLIKVHDQGLAMSTECAGDIHDMATGSLRHFVMPRVPDGVTYCAEYEWVRSPGYIGPDRRLEDTSFLSRHSFTGKRRVIPKHWPGPLAAIDGMSRDSRRYLLLFLLCSTADLILTLVFIGHGLFREANPVLAWAIRHPITFSLTKTGLALGGYALLSRLQLWRRALVARLAIFVYLLLLIYWLVLIARL